MKWFTARAQADDPRKARVAITKPIGSDWAPDWIADFTGEQPANDFIAEIEALGELDEIHLELNSPGGDVASGVRIFNYLSNHRAKVHVRVTGQVASITTVIMMAGDTRTMGVGTTIMTHRAASLMVGFYTAAEMREMAGNVEVIDAAIVEAYVSATGKSADEIGALLDQGDTYMGADEAIAWGFATDKDAKLQAVACSDPRLFMDQIKQQGKIRSLEAQLAGKPAEPASMTAAEALALAFDLTPEEAEAQAADLGDQIIALRQQAPVSDDLEPITLVANALMLDPDEMRKDPKQIIDKLKDLRENGSFSAADLTAEVDRERARITAILKACETTGQTQLLEKLVANGMPEAQASEYIYDVAAASGNRHSIHNSHSPEGGHKAGIDYAKIYARQNRAKATA